MNKKAGIMLSLILLAVAFVAGALIGRQVLPISGNVVFEDEALELRDKINELQEKISKLRDEGLGFDEMYLEDASYCKWDEDCTIKYDCEACEFATGNVWLVSDGCSEEEFSESCGELVEEIYCEENVCNSKDKE
jgi:hypothetical protein